MDVKAGRRAYTDDYIDDFSDVNHFKLLLHAEVYCCETFYALSIFLAVIHF